MGKEFFTSADNYILSLNDQWEPTPALRTLLLAAAIAIGLATTVCCAWRWRLVARGLGVDMPMRVAVASYYRSQFLNSTLPGGMVGDVHRAVSHGRDAGNMSGGVRAVAA